MFSSLDTNLNFPEYFLMAASYRFTRNLKVAIKDSEKYSSNLGKSLREDGWEDHFKLKLRSEACHLDFQNIFQNRLRWKVCGRVCTLNIVRMYSVTGTLRYYATFNFWKTQNMFESSSIILTLSNIISKNNEDFAMERWSAIYFAHLSTML